MSPDSPESIAVVIAINTINTENWTKLYQSVSDLKIIDPCHREDHTLSYIETSYHLPLVNTNCVLLAKPAKTKDQAMVFYCNGNAADACINALQIVSALGDKGLLWLRGGFVEGEDKDYPYVIE